jgi:hypothetical protein
MLRKDAEKIRVRKEEKVDAPSFARSHSLHFSAPLRKFIRSWKAGDRTRKCVLLQIDPWPSGLGY